MHTTAFIPGKTLKQETVFSCFDQRLKANDVRKEGEIAVFSESLFRTGSGWVTVSESNDSEVRQSHIYFHYTNPGI